MPILVDDVWREDSEHYVMVGNTWRKAEATYVMIGGEWKEHASIGYTPPTLSISRAICTGYRSSKGNITTSTTSVQILGGTGHFSYTWEKVSGSTFTINKSGGSASATSYSSFSREVDGVYRCKVTEYTSEGKTEIKNTHYSSNVIFRMEWNIIGGIEK